MNKVRRGLRRERIAAGTATELGTHFWQRKNPLDETPSSGDNRDRAEQKRARRRERNLDRRFLETMSNG